MNKKNKKRNSFLSTIRRQQDSLSIIGYGLLAIFLFILPAQSQSTKPEIILTWSTNTYVPLDYPGKPLPALGDNIEMAAEINPHQGIDPEKMIYHWFIDDEIYKADSGQGKQIFNFNLKESIIKTYFVKVEVYNPQGNFIGTSSYLPIKPYEPQLILKTKNPSLSLTSPEPNQKYQIAANQGIEFIAQPYFFDIKSLNDLSFDWIFDEEKASPVSQENPYLFALKIGQIAKSMEKQLTVEVLNKNNPNQRIQTIAEIFLIP